jgi:hypothetical protein
MYYTVYGSGLLKRVGRLSWNMYQMTEHIP